MSEQDHEHGHEREDAMLDELRAAWHAQRVPVSPILDPHGTEDEGAGEGDALDASLRAWWTDSWRALPVPPCPDPLVAIPAARRSAPVATAPVAYVRRAWPSAAAAVLLGLLGATLWRHGGPGRVPSEALPSAGGRAAADRQPRICAVADDRVELCTGRVRLVLLTDPAPSEARFSQETNR